MRKKRNSSSFVVLLIVSVLVGGTLFVSFSNMFERKSPEIELVTNGYWNLKTPLDVSIKDESGIKSYKISMKMHGEVKTLEYEQLISPEKSLLLRVNPPRTAYAMKVKSLEIIVEARDASKWNFLKGNTFKKSFILTVDKRRPKLNIVANSYKISKGGSALVIFELEDENIKEFYIESKSKKRFYPQPFYKDGYFISLLAWPVTERSFKATIVAKDKAGNVAKTYIPLYLKERNYRVSHIKISDRFLKGKIADLAEIFEETQGVDSPLEQFKIINEDVRAKNEALIHKLSSKIKDTKIDTFHINKMYPLKNAKVVASFGDHRKYTYNGEYLSESYHLGLDLASNAMAKIKPQNGGEVVFADFNGLYGNMPMVSHGLGLYTIYGHCSNIKLSRGDMLRKKETLANTGKSGYAMGDHLHFGVLVQGVEVRPQEWMDKQWIKLNITDIIKESKKIIDRN